MLRFNKSMLQDGAKRLNTWLKKGEGLPKLAQDDRHRL